MATGNGNPQPAVAAGCAGKKERERYLDLLKGLAILFVILVHFNIACHCPVGIISKLTTIGARSPQLFFIISSFLIYRSCFGKDIDLWRFWKKRWIRLAPLYYAALVLFILFFKREMIVTDPLNIISHFLFLHGFNPHWIYGVIGVDWYVADIAIFYLIAPFLLRVVTNLKTSIVALFFGIIVSAITLIVYNQIKPHLGSDQYISMYFETSIFFHQFPVLMLGIVLFFICKEIDGSLLRHVKTLLVAVGAGVAVFLALFVLLHWNKRFCTSSFVAGLIFSWFFLALYTCKTKINKFIPRPLAKMGEHSYGIYMLHQMIINLFLLLPFASGSKSFLFWGISASAVILLSFGLGFLFEKLQQIVTSYCSSRVSSQTQA